MWAVQKTYSEAITQRPNQTTGTAGGVINWEALESWSVRYDTEASSALSGLKLDLPESSKKILRPYVRLGRLLAA
jgi:hypothetical protein